MLKRVIMIFSLGAIALLAGCVNVSSNHSSQPTTAIERNYYNPWEKDVGFAQVVKAGDTLYLSGITSDKEGFSDQLDDIYTTITKILDDYGLDARAIVKEVIYTTDVEGFKEVISARKKYFEEGFYPASTLVQVEQLYVKSWLLEVEIVAVINKN